MLKKDFYNALSINLRDKADISLESLKEGSSLIVYKLGHDKTSLESFPFIKVTIKRNIVDIYTYDNTIHHMDLISSIDWNKSYTPNMVSLTQKEIEKQLTVI